MQAEFRSEIEIFVGINVKPGEAQRSYGSFFLMQRAFGDVAIRAVVPPKKDGHEQIELLVHDVVEI